MVEKGQLKTNWESFTLDATTFEHNGTRYLLWAQSQTGINSNSNLYIAKMNSPLAISGNQVMITTSASSDLLDPASWSKSSNPVFKTNSINNKTVKSRGY
ncbi:MAG TPA: family 43 glycosylhydrolase [Pseudobacteroides sp.]